MSGSEGRFPKTLIEFRVALRPKARARRTWSSVAGRKGLSAPAAATGGRGF